MSMNAKGYQRSGDRGGVACAVMAILFGIVACFALTAFPNEMTFEVNASLTNGTGWVFTDVKSSSEGYYFGKAGATMSSPDLALVITSVVINVCGSNTNTTRRVYVEPGGNMIAYSKHYSQFEVTYAFELGNRRVTLRSEGGDTNNPGNVYVSSITVRGVPYVPPPAEVAVLVTNCTSCVLRWENPEGAVSNTIFFYRREYAPDRDEKPCSYDFGFLEGPASGSPRNCYGLVMERYPELGGERLYAPVGTTGVLQLGTGDARGTLVLPAVDDYADLVLKMEIRAHDTDITFRNLCTGYIDCRGTNGFDSVSLSHEDFELVEFDVSDASPGSRIVINCDVNKSNRRLLMKSVELVRRSPLSREFVMEGELCCEVSGGGATSMKLEGLMKDSEYRFGLVAWTEEGRSLEVLSGGVYPKGTSGAVLMLW